jgi:hypothetical protein
MKRPGRSGRPRACMGREWGLDDATNTGCECRYAAGLQFGRVGGLPCRAGKVRRRTAQRVGRARPVPGFLPARCPQRPFAPVTRSPTGLRWRAPAANRRPLVERSPRSHASGRAGPHFRPDVELSGDSSSILACRRPSSTVFVSRGTDAARGRGRWGRLAATTVGTSPRETRTGKLVGPAPHRKRCCRSEALLRLLDGVHTGYTEATGPSRSVTLCDPCRASIRRRGARAAIMLGSVPR